ncbi:MAG: hypothetical protein LBS18_07075 [Clostridiales bacterium]|jgi:hypothetical protein|nr:hypothetical protein [Clostridiales bacterium]
MKKLLTLTLIVVMALGLAAPALAYTTNTEPESGASPFTVDIYLVDNAGADPLANLLSLPNDDRGYAKNEIIAAIGALTVPKGEYVFGAGYTQLRFKPKNVSFNVMDNTPTTTSVALVNNSANTLGAAGAVSWGTWAFAATTTGLVTHTIVTGAAPAANTLPTNANADYTFRTLIYGKVLDDDASLTFELMRGANWTANTAGVALTGGFTFGAPTHVLVLSEDLLVWANSATPVGPTTYTIHENIATGLGFNTPANASPGPLRFAIVTSNSKGKTDGLYMYPNGVSGESYRIHVEPSTQHLVFVKVNDSTGAATTPDQIKYGTAGYASLLAFYEEWFEGKLGFSAYNEGNLLTASDWTDIAAAAIDISDTVDIEPWTAYVKVPENIVV